MKKTFTTLVVVFAITQFSYAQQWTNVSGTNDITNTNSGNAGIGTTSPSSKLELRGNAGLGGVIDGLTVSNTNPLYTTKARMGSNFDGNYITENAYFDGSNWLADNTGRAVAAIALTSNNADGNIVFYTSATNNAGFGTQKMVIDKNGNVGIGTTSPGAKLQINSSAGAAYAPVLSLTQGGNPTYGFSFLQDDLTTGDLQLNRVNADTSMQMMTFQRNTGNVGVGTTTPFTTLIIPSSTNSKYIGWDYNNGSSGSRRWWFGNDQIEYGDFSFATESTQGRSAPDLTRLYIKANGNVGIGTTSPDEKITVKGKIHAEEVKIDLSVPAPDYVFENGYKLPALNYLKSYVDKNHYLPEIPSAKEMARDGLKLGEMNTLSLKKVEELTLYLIEKDQQVNSLQSEVADLKTAIKAINKALIKNKQ